MASAIPEKPFDPEPTGNSPTGRGGEPRWSAFSVGIGFFRGAAGAGPAASVYIELLLHGPQSRRRWSSCLRIYRIAIARATEPPAPPALVQMHPYI